MKDFVDGNGVFESEEESLAYWRGHKEPQNKEKLRIPI